MDNSNLAPYLTVTSQISGQPQNKALTAWNGTVDMWLESRPYGRMNVTVAGPPQCEDRPWWWGR